MILQNKTSQKIISFLVIISILVPVLLFSKPQQVNAKVDLSKLCPPAEPTPTAVPVFDYLTEGSSGLTCVTSIKGWAQKLLELTLQAAARKALQKITQSTISWINSGFHGQPLFLENPESFFKDIAKSQLKSLVDLLGYDSLKYPYGKDFALNAINAYKSKFEDNTAYSLSSVIDDEVYLEAFRTDFNVGGWDGFLLNTQYQQNNPLGFEIIVSEELSKRIEGTVMAPAQKVQDTLNQGMGFLSPQTCPSNEKYNNGYNEFVRPSFNDSKYREEHPISENATQEELEKWGNEYEAAMLKFDEEDTCPGGLVSTTPGSVVSSQITKALGASQDSTTLAGAMGNSLSAILDALLNHFFDEGLSALADTINPPPEKDNWSYDGQTLEENNDINPDALDIPQNVSILIGDPITNPSSTTISDGIKPYKIETAPNSGVAQVTILDNVLTITGIAPGTTSVTITDSSLPIKRVAIQITVLNSGELMAVPANIIVGTGGNASATISGGEEPYFMTMNSNQQIAQTLFSDNTLIVTGLASGTTSVTIKDSSLPTPKTLNINITTESAEDITSTPTPEIPATGICTLKNTPIKNMTQSACTTIKGTWVEDNL